MLEGIGEINNSATINITKGAINTTDYYDINLKTEVLKLKKRAITITLLGKEETYNGVTTLSREEYAQEGTLADGETLSVTNYAVLEGVGQIYNDATITIKRNTTNTTDYYAVTIIREKIILNARPITIRLLGREEIFNGNLTLSNEKYELVKGNIVEGEILSVTDYAVLEGIGSMDNDATITIKRGSVETTEYYDITVIREKLIIRNARLVITFYNGHKIYDGTPLDCKVYTYEGELFDNTLVLSDFSSITYVGSTENCATVTVLNKYEQDITDCFDITINKGTLTIDKRVITIDFKNARREYNGLVLYGEYEIIGSIADTDMFTIAELPSIIYVGSIENYSEFTIRRNVVGEDYLKDVEFCYDITINKGTLTIDKRAITIDFKSARREYNGLALYGEYEIIGSIADTDMFTIAELPSIIYVGSIENYSEFTITRNVVGEDYLKDVEFCYDITVNRGTLTIDKAPLTILTNTKVEYYCADEIKDLGYTITYGEVFVDTGDLLFVIEYSSIIDVGRIDNVLKVVIKKGDIDVTTSYDITINYGYLEVKPSPITIKAPSIIKVYDGQKILDYGTCEIVSERGLFGNDSVSYDILITLNGEKIEPIDAGVYKTQLINVKIDNGEKDVTGNYLITLEDGEVVIEKREISFRPIDKEKPFDNTPLVSSEYEITSGSLAVGQKETLTISGSITYPGESDNLITSVVIKDGEKDVTHNYLISVEKGILKVTKRYIVVTPINYSKTYDGAVALYPSQIRKEDLAYAEWQDASHSKYGNALYSGCILEATIKVDSQIINVGRTTSSIVSYDIKYNGTSVLEYYDVVLNNGTVTVKPRVIEVSSRDVKKVYDGTPLVGTTEDCSISKGSLIGNDQISYELNAQITEVGAVENKIVSVVIRDGGTIVGYAEFGDSGVLLDGNYDYYNYQIRVNNGSLTVLEQPTQEQS